MTTSHSGSTSTPGLPGNASLPDFSRIPVSPPPPGVVPNFVNPTNVIGEFTTIAAIGSLITVVVVGLRLYTRAVIVKQIGYEDYFLVIGVLLGIVNVVIGTEMGSSGYGVHAWNVPLSHFSRFLLLDFITIIVYNHILLFVKLAILGLYYRLSSPVSPHIRRFVVFMMCVVVAYTIGALTSLLMLCDKVSDHWNIAYPHCKGNPILFFKATGMANIVTDFTILMIPVPMLWRLRMPRRQKIGAVGILMAGSASCFLSIARIVTLIPALESYDATYDTIKVGIFSHMESQIAILCACLPTLKPLLKRHFNGLFEKLSKPDDIPSARFPTADKIDVSITEDVEKAFPKPPSTTLSREQPKVEGVCMREFEKAVVLESVYFYSYV